MKKPEVIYCGEINKNHESWRFQVTEIPIIAYGKTTPIFYEVEHPYFQWSCNNSSRFFEASAFDKKMEITENLTLYYSLDKNKAADFVKSEYAAQLDRITKDYYSIQNAELSFDEKEEDKDR